MKKAIEARFYKSSNGSMPVKNWLKALPKKCRKIIGEDILTVEMGWPIGMPVAKSLEKGFGKYVVIFQTGYRE